MRPSGPRTAAAKRALSINLTQQLLSASSAEALLNLLAPELDNKWLDPINFGVAFTRLARFRGSSTRSLQTSPVIPKLVARTAEVLLTDAMEGRTASNILWAIATLGKSGLQMRELVPALTRLISIKVGGMKQQETASAIWAAATLQLPEPLLKQLLPPLVSHVKDLKETVDEQSTGNLIWATASLKGRAPELLEAEECWTELLLRHAPHLSPQGFSGVAWAAATLKNEAPTLLAALPQIVATCQLPIEQLTDQGVSNLTWAVAVLKDEVPELRSLLPKALAQLPRISQSVTVQSLSNIVWAGAALRFQELPLWHSLLPLLCQLTLSKLSSANAQDVSSLTWSFSLLDDGSPAARKTLTKLSQVAPAQVGTMNPQGLANTCYGLAFRGIPSTAFLEAVAATVGKGLGKWIANDKAMSLGPITWAFAKIGGSGPPPQLMEVIASHVEDVMELVNDWALCAVIWAFGRLKVKVRPSFTRKVGAELRRRHLGPEAVAASEFGIEAFQQWEAKQQELIT